MVFCFCISVARLASSNNWKMLVCHKLSFLKACLSFTAFWCCEDDKWHEPVLFGCSPKSPTLFIKDVGPEILWANNEQIKQICSTCPFQCYCTKNQEKVTHTYS